MFNDDQDYSRARSFADTPLFAMLNAGACVTAAIAAAACWIVWAVTFTPWVQHPRGGRVLVALAVTAAAASGLTAVGALGGQPGYDPATHQYTLNNHGNLTVVSKAAYLHAGRPVAATLAPGQYTVFAGCTQEMTSCAHLAPGSVTVRGASGEVAVGPDPSSDHDTEGEPFVGELSFVIPRASAVRIELAADPGQPVFVVPSEGQLVRSLIGWIVLAGAGLLTLLLSLAGLGILAWWRLTPAPSQFVPGAEPFRRDGGPGAP